MSEDRDVVLFRIDRTTGRLILAALAVILAGFAVSENVTLTTTYPAPSGIYTKMITTGDTFLARDGGKVGIGTATPATALDVSGGIRPGAATTAAVCDTPGAFGYDYGIQEPVYCKGTSWTPFVAGAGPTILADNWYPTETDIAIPYTGTGKILLTVQFSGGQGGNAWINITFLWGLGSLTHTQIMNQGGVNYQTPFSPSLATSLSPAGPGTVHVKVHTVNVLGGYGAPPRARILAVQY